MQAAAAAGHAARAQLTDELPASCLGSLLALLLAQVRSEQPGLCKTSQYMRARAPTAYGMLILAVRGLVALRQVLLAGRL